MNREDRRYHRDFDFKHYYKFVPPLGLTIVSLIKPAIGAVILYAIFAFVHLKDVADYVKDFFGLYFFAVFANVARYHISLHRGMVRTSAVVGLGSDYLRGDIAERRVDVKNYILHKANRNVFICGTSGQGKSFLTRYLLGLFPNQKIVFSFKANDEYLKVGYQIVDMSKALPNPFVKPEAFLNAYLITFPIGTLGITAEQIPAFVRELARASHSWQEFQDNLQRKVAHTKDKIQQSALVFVSNTIKTLVSDQAYVVDIGEKDIVFDFSKLNPDAKTFYAEVILRQLWEELTIEEKRTNILICVDEAHRLLRRFEKYESIFNEMSREIRAYGMLWTSTQNFSDMDDEIRNQFATQFTFNTNQPEDVRALGATDPMLSWSVTSLELHVFTDARYQWVHEAIPEFYLYYKPKDQPRAYMEGVKAGGGSEGGGREGGEEAAGIDFRQEIRDILGAQPAYATQMGKLIAEKYGIDKDKAKLGAKTALNKMLQNDEIESMKMHDKTGQVVVIYFTQSTNMSDLHKLMQSSIAAWLAKKGIKIMKEGRVGSRSTPDLETEGYNIEIETGLKHSQEDLKTRLLKATKKTYIVVPNEDVLAKYKNLRSDKVDIVTIEGFEEHAT